jgi:hypothetical protein
MKMTIIKEDGKKGKKIIRSWFEMGMDDQMKIDKIMQEEPEIGDDIE